jgi:hypothetical protein
MISKDRGIHINRETIIGGTFIGAIALLALLADPGVINASSNSQARAESQISSCLNQSSLIDARSKLSPGEWTPRETMDNSLVYTKGEGKRMTNMGEANVQISPDAFRNVLLEIGAKKGTKQQIEKYLKINSLYIDLTFNTSIIDPKQPAGRFDIVKDQKFGNIGVLFFPSNTVDRYLSAFKAFKQTHHYASTLSKPEGVVLNELMHQYQCIVGEEIENSNDLRVFCAGIGAIIGLAVALRTCKGYLSLIGIPALMIGGIFLGSQIAYSIIDPAEGNVLKLVSEVQQAEWFNNYRGMFFNIDPSKK